MTKSIVVVKVPTTYTAEQKQDLELQVNRVVDTGGAIVVPDEVDITVLHLEDTF
jgi:hypothetical protein